MSLDGILLDIEGTTTPVAFVYNLLFPFAKKRMKDFLLKHSETEEVRTAISLLEKEKSSDIEKGLMPPEKIGDYSHWLMEKDRKSTGLKILQGKIWEEGYRSGELKGEIYPDVVPALSRWRNEKTKIAIFSSGSVLAQKLIFGNTDYGNLLEYFSGFFDTTTGPKTAPESYAKIARELKIPPENTLFISDVAAELDAAKSAGMQTRLCVREGSAPSSLHPVIHTLIGTTTY